MINYDKSAPNSPPVTYRFDAEFIRDFLSYEEMIALSGLFRRWAVYECLTPERRTRTMMWSADFEEIAKWVGIGWRPTEANSGDEMLKSLAMAARHHSIVVWVDFER